MSRAYSPPQVAICRPHWWEILTSLKCSLGMPVKEISTLLEMSYMGIRQHLDTMEKEKLVEAVRRPRKVGRPEKLYRLTERGQSVFQNRDPEILGTMLGEASNLFDSHAPEKLLMHYFEDQKALIGEEISASSIAEKAEELARIRDEHGYFSRCVYDREGGLRIEEYHHPFGSLVTEFPSLARYEKDLFERVLGTHVRRVEERAGTHLQVRWEIPTVDKEVAA